MSPDIEHTSWVALSAQSTVPKRMGASSAFKIWAAFLNSRSRRKHDVQLQHKCFIEEEKKDTIKPP